MKKKFAILITGFLRTFERNYKYLDKIFDDFDVYVYTLDTQEHFEILKRLSIKNYELFNESEIDTSEFKNFERLFRQSYAIQNDHNVIKTKTSWLYQLKNYKDAFNWFDEFDREYDLIVRYRPDLKATKVKNPIFLNSMFNCFQQNTYKNHINDKFFVSNYQIMKYFMCNIFDSLKDDNIINYAEVDFNAEQYIYSFLHKNSVDINLINKNSLRFKKDTNGKVLSAGFDRYSPKSIKNKLFD